MARIAVLGGNGFVGQRVLEELVARQHHVRCFSRSGSKPIHMQNKEFAWSENVEWLKADGTELSPQQLAGCDALICLVGAPPIPRLGSQAIKKERYYNGAANVHAIKAARQAGIERLALLGARIPSFARNRFFGYFLGKRDSLREAYDFAELPKRRIFIAQPFLITGKRYLKSGKAIPLDIMLAPFQAISFGLLTSVEVIAHQLVASVINEV